MYRYTEEGPPSPSLRLSHEPGCSSYASPRLVDLHFTGRFQAVQMCAVNAVNPCHTE